MLPAAAGSVQYFHGVFTSRGVLRLVMCNIGLCVSIVLILYNCCCLYIYKCQMLLLGHQPFYLNNTVIRPLNQNSSLPLKRTIDIEIDIFQWITLNPFKI